jgi:hypothetical protein
MEILDKKTSLAPEKKLIRMYLIFLIIVSVMVIVYFIGHLLAEDVLKIAFLWAISYNILLSFYYYLSYHYYEELKDNRALPYLHTFLEISTLSVAIYFMKEVYGSTVILTGPMTMFYIALIFMTSYRGRKDLAVFATIVTLVEHGLIFWILLEEVPFSFKVKLIDLGWSGFLQKNVYFILSGAGSLVLASEIAQGRQAQKAIQESTD